jgi:hypothetical protein
VTVPLIPPHLVRAGKYRLWAFLAILVTNGYCLLLLFFAPQIRPVSKGPLGFSDADSVVLAQVFCIGFPCLILFGAYFSLKGWAIARNELLHRWQAYISVGTVLLLCLWIVGYLSVAVLFFDFKEPLGPGGRVPAVEFPMERSLGFLAGR